MSDSREVDEPIHLLPHDPNWRSMFDAEATMLDAAIGRWAPGGIHHVGSTAVPGLSAKPIIDILVGVDSLHASRPCIPLLEPLQYCYAPYRATRMHWLCKPDPARRTHHLHLVPTHSRRFADELAFRDYLRCHADRAGEYEQLKLALAAEHRHDRAAYTDGKSAFIHETLRLAGSNVDATPAAPHPVRRTHP